MKKKYYVIFLLLFALSATLAADDPNVDLPPCPAHIGYLPQKLPMHCKMPSNPYPKGLMPFSIPGMNAPAGGIPLPMPAPAGGIPLPMPAPAGGMPVSMQLPPEGVPMPPGLPGMPGPIPMPMPGSPQKLPVIVMPFYSQNGGSFKKTTTTKRPHRHRRRQRGQHHHHSSSSSDSSSSDTSDTSSDTSGDRGFWSSKRRRNRKRNPYNFRRMNKNQLREKNPLLTPLLQYINKDGNVIYEKQISNNEANDWLQTNNELNGVLKENPKDTKEKDKESVSDEDRDVVQKFSKVLHVPRAKLAKVTIRKSNKRRIT